MLNFHGMGGDLLTTEKTVGFKYEILNLVSEIKCYPNMRDWLGFTYTKQSSTVNFFVRVHKFMPQNFTFIIGIKC